MNKITKTYNITATPDTLLRFEKFLCMLHYNGGHSGIFGMTFDGDGHESFKCDPPPIKINRDHHIIADAGPELEIAYNSCYKSFSRSYDTHHYKAKDNKLIKVHIDGTEEIRRSYE